MQIFQGGSNENSVAKVMKMSACAYFHRHSFYKSNLEGNKDKYERQMQVFECFEQQVAYFILCANFLKTIHFSSC